MGGETPPIPAILTAVPECVDEASCRALTAQEEGALWDHVYELRARLVVVERYAARAWLCGGGGEP